MSFRVIVIQVFEEREFYMDAAEIAKDQIDKNQHVDWLLDDDTTIFVDKSQVSGTLTTKDKVYKK